MKNYEALFILKPDLNKEKIQELFNQINDTLTKNNARVISSSIWSEKRKLAYTVKKYKEGTYYLMNFHAEPLSLAKINEEYKINENILRILITRQMKPQLMERKAT